MTSTSRFMRPLLFGAVVLSLASAGACGWLKPKSTYTTSMENRPLEVPPDLDLPNTSAATPLPTASGLGGAQSGSTSGVTIPGSATDNYAKVGTALEGIEGVTISGRAEALNSYDVSYQGQGFLIRILDSAGGSRLVALSADGRMLTTGPAAELLAAVKAKL